MERTLVLAKPDAYARRLSGEILARFERKGLVPVALRVLRIAGFSGRDAARMARVMAVFLNGVVLAEIADPAAMDGVFERGLIMVLDGIARSLQRLSVLS